MNLLSIRVDMRDRVIMNCRWNAPCILRYTHSFVSCNSMNNNIMIELLVSKSLKIICLIKYFFKFYPWNRIAKNVKERSPATLGFKIIHTLEESLDCDWNDKEDLNERPQVMSQPT